MATEMMATEMMATEMMATEMMVPTAPTKKSPTVSGITPYWRPDGLALPQKTRTLAWNRNIIDPAVIWFVGRLASVASSPAISTSNEEPLAPPLNLQRIQDDLLFKVLDGFADTRNRRFSGNHHGRFDKTHDRILPWHAPTEDILLVGVPMVKRSCHSWDDPEANTQSYLVFRKTAGAHKSDTLWALFPRSLRHKCWDGRPSTLMRKSSVEQLAPLWCAAIDALPPTALTRAERKAGREALFGVLLDTDDILHRHSGDPSATDRRAAFWRAAGGAIRTLACARGVTLSAPPPPKQYRMDRFTWGVFTDHIDPGQGVSLPAPAHRVKIAWNGWNRLGFSSLYDDEQVPVTPEGADKVLASIQEDMASILNRMAPADDPFFFDQCSFTQQDVESGSKIRSALSYKAPEWGPEDHPAKASGHEMMRQLTSLPADWRKAVMGFL